MTDTILITGGAGFIGSNLAAAALRAGHEVVILDDFSTGYRDNVVDGIRQALVKFVLTPEDV